MFSQRVVGLRLGEIVYDGTPEGLNDDVLTEIYGEEDWHINKYAPKAAQQESSWDEEDTEEPGATAS